MFLPLRRGSGGRAAAPGPAVVLASASVPCLRSVPGSCSDPEPVPAAPNLPLQRSWLLQRFRTAAELCP